MASSMSRLPLPTVEETLKHPAYPTTIWKLVPTQEGILPVAEGRGGPIKISWEVHGSGPIKVVLIMGLGSFKSAWQRQTLYLGHEREEEFSVLVLDNRGMGLSDRPLRGVSTSEMAFDVLEVADHLGWTGRRQLHVAGISMGGMIAQELACATPHRIASLNLLCTAAAIHNTTTFMQNLANRASLLIPRGVQVSVDGAAHRLFPEEWLRRPDEAHLPAKGTPLVEMPSAEESGGKGEYLRFGTNYERFVAQEMTKRLDTEHFTTIGFLTQLVAAGWHSKSRRDLFEMACKVGRERIMVLHGTADQMISVPHGRQLIELLEPAEGIIVEGMGHAPVLERCDWVNHLLERCFRTAEALNTEVK